MINGNFANVIIDVSCEKLDHPFSYIIPDELKNEINVGDCVEVPFGAGDTMKKAFVISISHQSEYPPEKMKAVSKKSEELMGVSDDAIRLARWMKETYGSTMIACLKTVLPAKKIVKMKEKKKIVRSAGVEEIYDLYAKAMKKKQGARMRVLYELTRESVLPYDLVTDKLHISSATLTSLARDGALSIESESYYRNPVTPFGALDNDIQLSDEQRFVIDDIIGEYRRGINVKTGGGKYLIHGITGSGKTEVYLNLIQEVINNHQQCIMLIPEIALTYQTLMRVYKRFGDRVSVINSNMSPGERYDQCMRAKNGDIDVIIGPRSALFVPFPNLGLVIIDEEHENSYISEQNPRYHARETAIELCRIKGASLVLGSATPSLESYYDAKEGEFKLYKLTKRLTGGELPQTYIVDLREELVAGNKSIFSRLLQDKIKDRLEKKEQIMLFLNRRGYSGFISCRACGHVMKCPHCDVSLSKHKGGKLLCHYCGYETSDVSVCPECGSKYISGFKAGTQQIEEALHKLYPGIRVLRMDADTTKTKDSYEKILSAFGEGEADVLVGTQMIVKGHDFPNVTLVGVVAADMSLNDSDFKTGERTFQLLTQAVGRSGRGNKKGEAIIQTYRPEHYSIVKAAEQDYESFYEEEIAYRMIGDYPPAGQMVQILVQSKDERRALGLATALKKRVGANVRCIGPAPASITKINDFYRYNLFIKSFDKKALEQTREVMELYLEEAPLETEIVSFDVK